MVKAFIYKLVQINRLWKSLFAMLLVAYIATGVAEPAGTDEYNITTAVVPLSAKGINIAAMKACVMGLTNQQCQNNQLCVAKYLTTQPQCNEVITIYNASHQIPVAARVYTNVTVVRLASGGYVLVDSDEQVIMPATHLKLENAPGFLELTQTVPYPQLSPQVQDFPAAVYLSQTSNQLLFLQDIIDATCRANCPPVAVAKVLYGFNVQGSFINAKVLRIIPPTANLASPG